MIEYIEEKLTADSYIEFLSRTNLGSQYPKERFFRENTQVKEMIEKLLKVFGLLIRSNA